MHGERLHRLREGVWAATTELRVLVAARGVDKDGIEERIARIGALRAQLRQELRDVRAELAAAGITDFPSHRRGPCPGHVRSVSRLG